MRAVNNTLREIILRERPLTVTNNDSLVLSPPYPFSPLPLAFPTPSPFLYSRLGTLKRLQRPFVHVAFRHSPPITPSRSFRSYEQSIAPQCNLLIIPDESFSITAKYTKRKSTVLLETPCSFGRAVVRTR